MESNISTNVATQKKKRRRYKPGHWAMTAMVSPAVILIFIFSYLPMVGLIIAFKNYKYNLGMFQSPWVGFDNFKFLVLSDTFLELVRNSVLYSLGMMAVGTIMPVIMAIMLDTVNRKRFVKLYQGSMFLPHFLSWIVVSYITHALFQFDYGVINNIIRTFGGEEISFYSEPKYWPLILTVASVWKGLGNGTLIYYGTIMGISPELYESASIDGCGWLGKIRYITIPHLKPPVILLSIMSIGSIFHNDFGLFYYLPKDTGALYNVTDVLDTYITRSIRSVGNMGLASAAGFLQSIVGFALVMITNAIVKRVDEALALY